MKGVREDVTDIILNLRGLVCRLVGEADEIEVELSRQGPGVVTAGDIACPSDLEILNPELEIANIEAGASLDMVLTIARGRGYVAADQNKGPGSTIGDLISKTEDDLSAIPNFGKKSIEEVKENLARHGLGLRDD